MERAARGPVVDVSKLRAGKWESPVSPVAVGCFTGLVMGGIGCGLCLDGLTRSAVILHQPPSVLIGLPTLSSILRFPDYYSFDFDGVAAELLLGVFCMFAGAGKALKSLLRGR